MREPAARLPYLGLPYLGLPCRIEQTGAPRSALPTARVAFSFPAMDSTKEQRTWAMIAHLSAFAYYLTGIGHLLGPLIVWLAKRDGNPFINDQGREALNFQISVTLYGLVGVVLTMTVILAVIGIPALIALHVFQIVCIIIAAIKANDGVAFRYPLTIRFLK